MLVARTDVFLRSGPPAEGEDPVAEWERPVFKCKNLQDASKKMWDERHQFLNNQKIFRYLLFMTMVLVVAFCWVGMDAGSVGTARSRPWRCASSTRSGRPGTRSWSWRRRATGGPGRRGRCWTRSTRTRCRCGAAGVGPARRRRRRGASLCSGAWARESARRACACSPRSRARAGPPAPAAPAGCRARRATGRAWRIPRRKVSASSYYSKETGRSKTWTRPTPRVGNGSRTTRRGKERKGRFSP